MKLFVAILCMILLAACAGGKPPEPVAHSSQQERSVEQRQAEQRQICGEASEGFTVFSADGLFGYLDEAGGVFLPAEYDEALPFLDGVGYLCKDGLWGHILKDGTLVPPAYTKPYVLNAGQAFVQYEAQGGVIDDHGNAIYPLQKMERGSFGAGRQYFAFSDVSGICLEDGEIRYLDGYRIEKVVSSYPRNALVVRTQEKPGLYGLVDEDLQFLLEPAYVDIGFPFGQDGDGTLCIQRQDADGRIRAASADNEPVADWIGYGLLNDPFTREPVGYCYPDYLHGYEPGIHYPADSQFYAFVDPATMTRVRYTFREAEDGHFIMTSCHYIVPDAE